jgi:fibronectin-binding autotransporter adhesin
LDNASNLTIGPRTGGLAAPTRVTASALVNTGNIYLTGNTNGVPADTATLNIGGVAGFGTLGVLTGNVYLNGAANLEFASGEISTIAAGANLQLWGASLITDASNTTQNSALTGLSLIAGGFNLAYGETLAIANNVTIASTGGWGIDGDNYSSEGGGSVTIAGTLTNDNNLTIGPTTGGLSSPTTLTVQGLVNAGVIQIVGNGTVAVATLQIDGPATNSDVVDINGSGKVVLGAGATYTQAAGATNIGSGGMLLAAGDTYTQVGGATNITSGGTLAATVDVTGGSLDGTGTVAGTVNDTSGTVFGGFSFGTPGTLTISGTYNQSGTGILEANIATGGGSSGVVAVTAGNFVNLTGGTLLVSATPSVGVAMTVMTFGAGDLIGQFDHVQDGSTIGDGGSVNLGDGSVL